MSHSHPPPSKFHVRYDLLETMQEAKSDFTADMGSRRLLKQSEIAARFRKPMRPARTEKK